MQHSSYVVRTCREEELPRLIELLKVTDLFWEIGDSAEVLRKKLEHDPDSILVLIEKASGKVIGMVTTIYDPWASFIWHVAVDPEYQGQGLGHLIAEEAEQRLYVRGTTSVNGYVLPDNERSLRFFHRRGYTDFGLVMAIEKVKKE